MDFMMYVKGKTQQEVESFINTNEAVFVTTKQYKIVESSDDILDINKPYEYVRGCPRHRVPTPEGTCPTCGEPGIILMRNVG